MKNEILRLAYLGKAGNQSMRCNISFSLYQGEALSIITEDLETKLILLDVLQGKVRPDQGAIYIHDKFCSLKTPEDAKKHGIYYVSDAQLIFSMNVAHNLFMTHKRFYNRFTILNNRSIHNAAAELLSEFSLNYVKTTTSVGSLSPVTRCLISILRAVSLQAKIIVLDNTCYHLYQQDDLESIQHVVTALKEKGISVIWFADKWANIFENFDSFAVIQDGAVTQISSVIPESFLHPNSVFRSRRTIQNPSTASVIFKCHNYIYKDYNQNKQSFEFSLHEHEILGICDKHNILNPLLLSIAQGKHIQNNPFFLNEMPYTDYMCGTVAFIYAYGYVNARVFLHMNLYDNITLLINNPIYNRVGFMNKRIRNHIATNALRSLHAEHLIEAYGNRPNLLGINAQDQLIIETAKWLCLKPKIFIFINPYETCENFPEYQLKYLLDILANLGISILILSSSKENLTKLCTRIITFP